MPIHILGNSPGFACKRAGDVRCRLGRLLARGKEPIRRGYRKWPFAPALTTVAK